MKTKKKLFAFLSSLGILIVLIGLYSFTTNSHIDKGFTPQTKWKNLKVLPQDISQDSLDYLMNNYSNSLGVNCTHCHAPSKKDPTKLDFANDDKIEKEIARGMISMTNGLNENFFKPHFPDPKPEQVHVVNCVMCHRGTVNPEKHLSKMGEMYKTYDPDRDNRKEKIIEEMQKK